MYNDFSHVLAIRVGSATERNSYPYSIFNDTMTPHVNTIDQYLNNVWFSFRKYSAKWIDSEFHIEIQIANIFLCVSVVIEQTNKN